MSDVYLVLSLLVLSLLVAVIGLILVHDTVSWPSWLFLLVVVWPIYRLYELALFVFGWIFVHTNPIYSIPRSLFAFFLNLLEIAILTTALEVALAGFPAPGRWGAFFVSLLDMVSLTPPTDAVNGITYSIGAPRFGLGVMIMICVIGGLAGRVVRQSLDQR